MSWKSDQLVACIAGCGAEVKQRRMKHHLRHHCPARKRKRHSKARRYRQRWGRKEVLPWTMKRLLSKARRMPGINGARVYAKGCRVIIDHPYRYTSTSTSSVW